MTKDEALDLALDALESGDGWRQSDAITAIKQALAVPVQEPVAWMDASGDIYKHELWPDWNPPHTPLYTTPPAAQPVRTLEELYALSREVSAEQSTQQDIQRLSALVRAQQITIDKLKAQRQFVGLTYAEKDELRYSHMTSAEFIDAIEAKLKEKNGM